MTLNDSRRKVVYLVGAGASHGCIKAFGSARGILMKDLAETLATEVHDLVNTRKRKYRELTDLVNDVIDDKSDFEHLITFLEDCPSAIHRQFADDLRRIFEKVLRDQLDAVAAELRHDRFGLYAALLDMYNVPNCPERLHAILTTNYDEYIEDAAVAVHGTPVDFGVRLQHLGVPNSDVKLVKLHGSFGWRDMWPIEGVRGKKAGRPLWIPPGIRKTKEHYPFNVLWGLARELLDCDVLRIIGCRLGGSDWDLISLLFTTRHAHAGGSRYTVEVIDSPRHAVELQQAYPYLDVRSILEIEDMGIGEQLVAEFTKGPPQEFKALSPSEQEQTLTQAGADRNWFRIWLVQMAEAFFREPEIGTVETSAGEFRKLLGAPQ